MKRALLGLIVAAAAFPVSAALYAALAGNGNLNDYVLVTLVIALYTFAITLVLGAPAAWLYHFAGWNRWWQTVLGGVAIGILLSVYSGYGLRGALSLVAVVGLVILLRGLFGRLRRSPIAVGVAVIALVAAAYALREYGQSPLWLASQLVWTVPVAVFSTAVFWVAGVRGNPWFTASAPR